MLVELAPVATHDTGQMLPRTMFSPEWDAAVPKSVRAGSTSRPHARRTTGGPFTER
jgi:hypothetical protein